MKVRNVAILLFHDVEVLDFAGPFEVFSVTRLANEFEPFRVYTVAKNMNAISARNALSINPHYTFGGLPAAGCCGCTGRRRYTPAPGRRRGTVLDNAVLCQG